MANLKYVAEASFTDPGKPDTRTARLDFGDGTVVQSDVFDSFSDAFGGATGRLKRSRRYRTPGTYTIRLEVKDDGLFALRVNDLQRERAAENKQRQLRLAAPAGLRVPHTLVTNDPAAARQFFAET